MWHARFLLSIAVVAVAEGGLCDEAAERDLLRQWSERIAAAAPDERERLIATAAELATVRQAMPRLVADLASQDPAARASAASELARFQEAAVPALVAGLDADAVDVRLRSAEVLGRIGLRAYKAVDALAAALGDDDAGVRAAAGWALAEMGNSAASALPRLIAALSDPADDVRHASLYALAGLGHRADRAAAEVKRIKEACTDHRTQALVALYSSAAGPPPYRTEVLRPFELRRFMAAVLEEPPASRSAIGRAVFAAEDPLAADAAGQPDETLDSFGRMAVREGRRLRLHRAGHIREMVYPECVELAKAAGVALPWLLDALADDESGIRVRAAGDLGSLRPRPEEAVPHLCRALEDEDSAVRAHSAAALGRIGIATDEVIAALEPVAREETPISRDAADWALSVLRLRPLAAPKGKESRSRYSR